MMNKRLPLALTSLLAAMVSSTFSLAQTAIPPVVQPGQSVPIDMDSMGGPLLRPGEPQKPHSPSLEEQFRAEDNRADYDATKDSARDLAHTGNGAKAADHLVGKNLAKKAKRAEEELAKTYKNEPQSNKYFRNNNAAQADRWNAHLNKKAADEAPGIFRNSNTGKTLKHLEQVGKAAGIAGDAATAIEVYEKIISDDEKMVVDGYEQGITEGIKKIPGLALGAAFGPPGQFAGDLAAEGADWLNKEPLDILAGEDGRPRSLNEFNADWMGEGWGDLTQLPNQWHHERNLEKHKEKMSKAKDKAMRERMEQIDMEHGRDPFDTPSYELPIDEQPDPLMTTLDELNKASLQALKEANRLNAAKAAAKKEQQNAKKQRQEESRYDGPCRNVCECAARNPNATQGC